MARLKVNLVLPLGSRVAWLSYCPSLSLSLLAYKTGPSLLQLPCASLSLYKAVEVPACCERGQGMPHSKNTPTFR